MLQVSSLSFVHVIETFQRSDKYLRMCNRTSLGNSQLPSSSCTLILAFTNTILTLRYKLTRNLCNEQKSSEISFVYIFRKQSRHWREEMKLNLRVETSGWMWWKTFMKRSLWIVKNAYKDRDFTPKPVPLTSTPSPSPPKYIKTCSFVFKVTNISFIYSLFVSKRHNYSTIFSNRTSGRRKSENLENVISFIA